MAGWFAKLMQQGHARSRRTIAAARRPTQGEAELCPPARDARYDAIVQMLRDRDAEDRVAREKRQRGYRQSLESDAGTERGASSAWSPVRLHRIRTKVPCRATPEAQALLDQLRRRFSGSTVSFVQADGGRQAVMLAGGAGTEPKQIGWLEQAVQADPTRCNVRDQGLAVETDGGRMLVLRFRYPATPVRVSARCNAPEPRPDDAHPSAPRATPPAAGDARELPDSATGEVARVDFTEIRPALDLRASAQAAAPRLAWVTRTEVEAMNALRSRDYEAFYVRLKLEVLAGIWSALSAVLAGAPGTRWHQGSCYSVVREPDAAKGRIHQRTIDDGGRAVDIGADRVYDAAHATDILLLYLDGDILADVADIYFTLQGLGSADAYFLKEELFTVVRRFWSGAQSLASRYGSDLAAVVRMSQRAVPMPAQALLLKQDWTSLRQSLVDRYGEGGRRAAELASQDVHRPRTRPPAWPFATFPAGEVNVGLRLVYRQEWRHLGAQRGEVIRTVPAAAAPEREPRSMRRVETAIEQDGATRSLDAVVDDTVRATVEAMKWPRDADGSINTGLRALAAMSDMGVEPESRESSRDACTRLADIVQRMASGTRDETVAAVSAPPAESPEPSPPAAADDAVGEDTATRVYSRLQNRYEVLTRPAGIQNVVLVAEKLPAPTEVDLSWVRRHDWIIARALLDESFRDALSTIRRDARSPRRDLALEAKRERLCEHVRANILHYQRAVWQQEDPQQRSMRYRKSGRKVPLEWRFELEAGPALTIDELGDRLAAANVDGQFATYSSGRDAELDQVIDPAGPIGYYGNYAIYQMRPEFGGEALFSMLHFFKSPWLRANPETGAPEVEDPEQLRLAEDPAVLGATDQAIAQHREEMLDYVAELRLELARARQQVSDGSDPGAVYRLERPGALRRHFATYLFRRERARRIVLDTNGQVIDVMRRVEPTAGEFPSRDVAIDRVAAPEGYRVILEEVRGIGLLRAGGHRDADGEAILRDAGARMPSPLAVGGGAVHADEREGEPMITVRGDEERSPGLRAGRAQDRGAEAAILARDAGAPMITALGGARAPADDERAIVARGANGDGEPTPSLHVGSGARHADERVLLSHADRRLRLIAPAREDATPARAQESPAEPVILARSDGNRPPILLAGVDAPHADQRMILVRDDATLRLASGAGAGSPRAHERVILAPSDGERTSSLRGGGRAHDPASGRVIAWRNDGGPALTAGAGAGSVQAHERAILAGSNGRLRPSLIAG